MKYQNLTAAKKVLCRLQDRHNKIVFHMTVVMIIHLNSTSLTNEGTWSSSAGSEGSSGDITFFPFLNLYKTKLRFKLYAFLIDCKNFENDS